MYFPDFSSTLENLDLKKTGASILEKNLDFLRGIYKHFMENISPITTTGLVLETYLEHCTPKEITPEMSEYLSRMTLRTLVGLPSININTKKKDAIKKLEGSISWITKEKIDVTEFIREMRESE